MTRAGAAACVAALLLAASAGCGERDDAGAGRELAVLFRVESLDRPESVAWDAARQRYLITSIGGEPAARDGDGFVTSVSSTGDSVSLRRFSSETPGVRLDAPKGIAATGDRAYVADLQRLVVLDLEGDTGLAAVRIPESRFLNDVAVGEDGAVYVSDTEADAVFRVDPEDLSWSRLPAAGSLRGANGLLPDPGGGGLVVAGWQGAVLRLEPGGAVVLLAEPRRVESLDGLQAAPDSGLLLTDHLRGTLDHIVEMEPGGRERSAVWLDGLQRPADFLVRDTVLALPEMGADRVTFYRLERR